MRYFFFLCLLSFLFVTSCSRSTAGVGIPAQQKFVLGEYMQEEYTAKLENQGKQTITVMLVDKQSQSVSKSITLESGDKTTLDVDPAYEVHLRNANNKEATIFVSMSKTVPGMRYVGKDEATPSGPEPEDTRVFVKPRDAAPAQESMKVKIPAGQQLIVGEGTSSSYTAHISSNRQISVSVRDKGTGAQTQGFGMRGTEKVTIRRYENIYLVNESDRDVTVTVKMNQPVSGERLTEATKPTGK